jgi:hypothetical protein
MVNSLSKYLIKNAKFVIISIKIDISEHFKKTSKKARLGNGLF